MTNPGECNKITLWPHCFASLKANNRPVNELVDFQHRSQISSTVRDLTLACVIIGYVTYHVKTPACTGELSYNCSGSRKLEYVPVVLAPMLLKAITLAVGR